MDPIDIAMVSTIVVVLALIAGFVIGVLVGAAPRFVLGFVHGLRGKPHDNRPPIRTRGGTV